MYNPQQMDSENEAAAKPRRPLVIRMDRSRDYGTVHGDRPQGDPHARVHFYQGGLPFNSEGILVEDHPEILEDPKKQQRVDRLRAKAEKLRQSAPGDEEDRDEADADLDDEERDEDDEDAPATFTLANWAAGRTQAPWQQVSDAITRKFSKRVQDKRSALELLIAEGAVNIGMLSPAHRAIVQSD